MNIPHFLSVHKEAAAFVALAFIGRMPEQLPLPFNRCAVFNWAWEWLHGGLKASVSFFSGKSKDTA